MYYIHCHIGKRIGHLIVQSPPDNLVSASAVMVYVYVYHNKPPSKAMIKQKN